MTVFLVAAGTLLAGIYCRPASGLGTSCPAAKEISSPQMLQDAIHCAQKGDTVRLAPGVRFGSLKLSQPVAHGLTITSADPSRPAILSALAAYNIDNLTVSHLDFTGIPSKGSQYVLLAMGGAGFTAENLRLTGDDDPTVQALNYAIMIRNMKGASVRKVKISNYRNGIALLNVSNLTLENNVISNIRIDGVSGGGVSAARIARNIIGNFHPAPGDHPDGIQLWSQNQDTSAENLMIESNLIYRGNGAVIQGVFVRDTEGLPFKNVSIRNNLAVGTMYNGITIMGAENVIISGNAVVPLDPMPTWIRVENSKIVEVRGNKAGGYIIKSKTTSSNNQVLRSRRDGASEISQWLKANDFQADVVPGEVN